MTTPLREYLDGRGESVDRFAKRLGIPLRTMYRYVQGERQAPLHHALAIWVATKRAVALESLVTETDNGTTPKRSRNRNGRHVSAGGRA